MRCRITVAVHPPLPAGGRPAHDVTRASTLPGTSYRRSTACRRPSRAAGRAERLRIDCQAVVRSGRRRRHCVVGGRCDLRAQRPTSAAAAGNSVSIFALSEHGSQRRPSCCPRPAALEPIPAASHDQPRPLRITIVHTAAAASGQSAGHSNDADDSERRDAAPVSARSSPPSATVAGVPSRSLHTHRPAGHPSSSCNRGLVRAPLSAERVGR